MDAQQAAFLRLFAHLLSEKFLKLGEVYEVRFKRGKWTEWDGEWKMRSELSGL